MESKWKRTEHSGRLTTDDISKDVTLNGWVSTIRDHGGLLFFHLRDRSGAIQVVFDPCKNNKAYNLAQEIRVEDVVSIKGSIIRRPEGAEHTSLDTKEIELEAVDLCILNKTKALPFSLEECEKVNENTRLKYRYLELRTNKLRNIFELKHKVKKTIRNYLDESGFWEVDTPYLTKSTPEGARDFLVPSRLNMGNFYALPQSPQLFKQLLMIGGVEKYYQIVRCFRDEDLRANRQPEFTQLDLEMSFIDEEDIFTTMEGLMQKVFSLIKVSIQTPFPRMTYAEAMEKYGTDAPDTRFDMHIINLTNCLNNTKLEVFRQVIDSGGVIKSLCIPKSDAEFSRNQIEEIREYAMKVLGAKGLAWAYIGKDDFTTSPIAKFFSKNETVEMLEAINGNDGDLVFFVADKNGVANNILARLRLYIAKKADIIPTNIYSGLWIVDFPLFEYDYERKCLSPVHHPFTSPQNEDEIFKDDLAENLKIKARAYDLVFNGQEIGGGSIRIHNTKLQKRIFELVGISESEAKEKFSFLTTALKYGAPPHGGIALGFDRLIAMLVGTESIKDVITFPKNQRGYCPLTDAPAHVSKQQKNELGIKLRQVANMVPISTTN